MVAQLTMAEQDADYQSGVAAIKAKNFSVVCGPAVCLVHAALSCSMQFVFTNILLPHTPAPVVTHAYAARPSQALGTEVGRTARAWCSRVLVSCC